MAVLVYGTVVWALMIVTWVVLNVVVAVLVPGSSVGVMLSSVDFLVTTLIYCSYEGVLVAFMVPVSALGVLVAAMVSVSALGVLLTSMVQHNIV